MELGTRESERGTLPFVYVRMFCFFTIDVSNSEASEAREELGTLRGTIKGKRNQTGNQPKLSTTPAAGRVLVFRDPARPLVVAVPPAGRLVSTNTEFLTVCLTQ